MIEILSISNVPAGFHTLVTTMLNRAYLYATLLLIDYLRLEHHKQQSTILVDQETDRQCYSLSADISWRYQSVDCWRKPKEIRT